MSKQHSRSTTRNMNNGNPGPSLNLLTPLPNTSYISMPCIAAFEDIPRILVLVVDVI